MGHDHFRDMRTDADEHICSNKIACMKHELVELMNCKLKGGAENVNTDEAGKVIDMIKDLAAAERYCAQACYYSSVVDAMEESKRYMSRMGYDPNEYMPEDDDDWRDREMTDRKLDRMKRSWRDKMRYGIRADGEEYIDPHYGKAFNEYRIAKKYYTETHSADDKRRMDDEAEHHITESIDTLKEIWNSSDPDLKQRMKTELTQLVGSMTV